jgi:hypothetical protein
MFDDLLLLCVLRAFHLLRSDFYIINLLPEFVDKIGNSPLELNENDMETFSYIVAKLYLKLCQIRKDYTSSKKYAEEVIRMFGHKKNIISAFMISNFSNLQPDKLYKTSETRDEINRDMQSGISDDISDLAGALTSRSEADENEYATSKDMNRALKMLEKDFGLILKTTKKDVKAIKGNQKIELSGRPSFYMLPPNFESIKRIIAQPNVIELVFNSLIKLGVLPSLQFVCEAAFYAFREYIVKEQQYDLASARIANKLVPDANDSIGWDFYRNLLLSLPEEQLKALANGLAQSMFQYPSVFRNIMLIALEKKEGEKSNNN